MGMLDTMIALAILTIGLAASYGLVSKSLASISRTNLVLEKLLIDEKTALDFPCVKLDETHEHNYKNDFLLCNWATGEHRTRLIIAPKAR